MLLMCDDPWEDSQKPDSGVTRLDSINTEQRRAIMSISTLLRASEGEGGRAACKSLVSSPDTKFFARALRPCRKIGSGHVHP